MKIACLVKFVPYVENFKYDYEKNIIIRENSYMQINPEDACALACGLLQKKDNDITIDAISMSPKSVLPLARDILRVGTDRFFLLNNKAFAGSDTFATSKILSSFLQNKDYDVILTGTHTLDGGTAQVPPQIAQFLNIPQISGITKIIEINAPKKIATIEVTRGDEIYTYQITLPAILSFSIDSGYKMPFVKYEDIDKDVDAKIDFFVSDLTDDQVGLTGSKTVVKKTYVGNTKSKDQLHVALDQNGIDTVYNFLVEKGYLHG